MDLFPPVPEEHRPRELIFDRLHPIDVDCLQRNGYSPVLLCTLPLRNDVEAYEYNRFLLRGVIDGTVTMNKERAEALNLDMRHRGMLKNINMNLSTSLTNKEDMKTILDWSPSKHAIGSTTVVPQKQVIDFVEAVRENHRRKLLEAENAPPQKPKRRIPRKRKKA